MNHSEFKNFEKPCFRALYIDVEWLDYDAPEAMVNLVHEVNHPKVRLNNQGINARVARHKYKLLEILVRPF